MINQRKYDHEVPQRKPHDVSVFLKLLVVNDSCGTLLRTFKGQKVATFSEKSPKPFRISPFSKHVPFLEGNSVLLAALIFSLHKCKQFFEVVYNLRQDRQAKTIVVKINRARVTRVIAIVQLQKHLKNVYIPFVVIMTHQKTVHTLSGALV